MHASGKAIYGTFFKVCVGSSLGEGLDTNVLEVQEVQRNDQEHGGIDGSL